MPFFLSTRFFVSDLHNFSPSGIEYVSILLTGYSYSIKFPRLHNSILIHIDTNVNIFCFMALTELCIFHWSSGRYDDTLCII